VSLLLGRPFQPHRTIFDNNFNIAINFLGQRTFRSFDTHEIVVVDIDFDPGRDCDQ
jgi:hypothetical protein